MIKIIQLVVLLLTVSTYDSLSQLVEVKTWYDAEETVVKEIFVARNNIKAGLYKIYHENGEMWQTGSFVDGKLDSTWLI